MDIGERGQENIVEKIGEEEDREGEEGQRDEIYIILEGTNVIELNSVVEVVCVLLQCTLTQAVGHTVREDPVSLWVSGEADVVAGLDTDHRE